MKSCRKEYTAYMCGCQKQFVSRAPSAALIGTARSICNLQWCLAAHFKGHRLRGLRSPQRLGHVLHTEKGQYPSWHFLYACRMLVQHSQGQLDGLLCPAWLVAMHAAEGDLPRCSWCAALEAPCCMSASLQQREAARCLAAAASLAWYWAKDYVFFRWGLTVCIIHVCC
jgi:hypothetical protein